VRALVASHALVRQDLARIEHFVHDLVEGLVARQKLIVKLRVARRVDAAEVLHAAEFVNRLCDKISISQLHARFEQFSYIIVLSFVLLDHFVDQELDLWVRLEAWDENIVCACLRDRNGASKGMIGHVGLRFASGCSCLLEASVLIAILELVQGLLATVEFANAAHIPGVHEQILLDRHIEGAVGRE